MLKFKSFNIFTKKNIYLIIFFSFLISIILSSIYVKNYDKIKVYQNDRAVHSMIKIAVNQVWKDANNIILDLDSGKNFFVAGDDYDEFLPQKFLALYYLLIDKEIYGENNILNVDNGKLGFLIIKTLLFYLSVFYLAKTLLDSFPIKNSLIIILFLCLEPTIFQYHSSFWNESLAYIFQILLISIFLKKKRTNFHYLIIGILTGLIYSIGQEFLFLFIPIIIYLIFIYKKKIFKPLISFITGCLLIYSCISAHNFYRTGNPYFVAEGSKGALYLYLVPNILQISNEMSISQVNSILINDQKKWANKNNIKLKDDNIRNIYDKIDDKNDERKYLNYLQKKSISTVIEYPITTILFIIKKTIHTLLLDPFYIRNFYKYDEVGKNKYYGTDNQKELIKFRAAYTIIIYSIIIKGFISIFNKKRNLTLLISLLCLYQISVLGWMGINRYFTPSLIYLSIFFSYGIFPQKKEN